MREVMVVNFDELCSLLSLPSFLYWEDCTISSEVGGVSLGSPLSFVSSWGSTLSEISFLCPIYWMISLWVVMLILFEITCMVTISDLQDFGLVLNTSKFEVISSDYMTTCPLSLFSGSSSALFLLTSLSWLHWICWSGACVLLGRGYSLSLFMSPFFCFVILLLFLLYLLKTI